MDKIKKKSLRLARIKQGIRKRVRGNSDRPRLTVYRSNTEMYAQIIDDKSGLTLAQASTHHLDKGDKGPKVAQAEKVGSLLAQRAKDANITNVVFDRNGYQYHGRVKALAEGARSAGLQF